MPGVPCRTPRLLYAVLMVKLGSGDDRFMLRQRLRLAIDSPLRCVSRRGKPDLRGLQCHKNHIINYSGYQYGPLQGFSDR
jgi:hypothetical protein